MSTVNVRKRPADNTSDANWSIVCDAVGAILKKTISRYSFQQIHQCVFLLCQRQCSGDLFDYLEKTLTSKVKEIRDHLLSTPKSVLLNELKAKWDDFSLAVRRISETLLYLNKNYTFHRPTIPQMGENLFYMLVLKDDDVSSIFVKCVQEVLTSGPVTRQALKELSPKLRGLYKAAFYEPCVEDPLIHVLRDQCSQHMKDIISTKSVSEYLLWVLDVIEKSKNDIYELVGGDSGERVEQNLGSVLIKQNTEQLLYGSSGGSTMVRTFDRDSMLRLGAALEKVNEIPALEDMAADTIKQIGLERLKEVDHNSPAIAVDKILALKAEAQKLFDGLPGVPKGDGSPVTRALTDIVNSDNGFAEKLAHYYDVQVKARPTDDRLDQIAMDTFSLFRLIRAKDAFEYVFKLLLASRIINSRPEDSIAHEAILIEQLKKEYGDSVANHLETMINDGRMRTEINGDFQRFIATRKELPIAFNVTVITAGVWPQYTNFAIDLPQSMQHCASLFEKYYLSRHNGRTLCFHKNLGTVSFTINHGKKYELVAPTSFAKTILCFDNHETWSLEQLCALTNLVEGDLASQLESLSQMRLITAINFNGAVKYGFNKEFSHPRSRLRVKTAYGSRTIEDNLELRSQQESLEATRSMSIQAMLVRIMKSRKTLDHSDLCGLVTESLKKMGFLPGMVDIKQNLEALIGKGLISRGSRPDCYVYES